MVAGSLVSRALRSRLLRQQSARSGVRLLDLRVHSITLRHYSQRAHVGDEQPVVTKREGLPRGQFGSPFKPPQFVRPEDVHDPLASRKKYKARADPAEVDAARDIDDYHKRERRFLLDIGANTEAGSSHALRKACREELRWIRDPHKLESRISLMLKHEEIHKAVVLVREAQRLGMKCVVSWNHVIHYCMERNQPEAAFKFYNDVSYFALWLLRRPCSGYWVRVCQ